MAKPKTAAQRGRVTKRRQKRTSTARTANGRTHSENVRIGKMARGKGKREEQAACEVLRPIAPECRRNFGQARARGEVPDVGPVPGYWVEVGAGSVNPRAKHAQAVDELDAHNKTAPLRHMRINDVPIALTRRTSGPMRHRRWLVTIDAEAFVRLVLASRTRDTALHLIGDEFGVGRFGQHVYGCSKDGDARDEPCDECDAVARKMGGRFDWDIRNG